jgi:hypothetical protein
VGVVLAGLELELHESGMVDPRHPHDSESVEGDGQVGENIVYFFNVASVMMNYFNLLSLSGLTEE